GPRRRAKREGRREAARSDARRPRRLLCGRGLCRRQTSPFAPSQAWTGRRQERARRGKERGSCVSFRVDRPRGPKHLERRKSSTLERNKPRWVRVGSLQTFGDLLAFFAFHQSDGGCRPAALEGRLHACRAKAAIGLDGARDRRAKRSLGLSITSPCSLASFRSSPSVIGSDFLIEPD